MRAHSLDERLGKIAHALFRRQKFPELIDLLRRVAALQVAPERILQGRFARFATFTHHLLSRSSAMTLEISTAARAASVPRLILSSRQRSRASFTWFPLKTAWMIGTPCSSAMRCNASVTERARCSA